MSDTIQAQAETARNIVVGIPLPPDVVADLSECASYYGSTRAGVIRLAAVALARRWRESRAPGAVAAPDIFTMCQ